MLSRALHKHGIDTIEKLAAQDINGLPKIPNASIETLNKAKIQAQSLVKKRPIFIESPEPIEEANLKLYFDVEAIKSLTLRSGKFFT
jgi:predicted RecB family nuclease